MITNWLPGITRHKNIVSPTLPSLSNGAKHVLVLIEKAYRSLGPDQLNSTTTLTMIPPPDVLIRLMVCIPHVDMKPENRANEQVLFRGVPDSEMKEWEARGLVHAEMGLDWTGVYVPFRLCQSGES